ncbi:hypothetical protein BP5796_06479 [Coleophoma crateriformis]|uniref:Uncharacterized protein n=1 Tax=Coleophoma crateriformis TaxID=565419 RepID=A0A3D8RNX8_9HELO|nr:hypothetical protein BP5796_06479 [Coleophoma crateriformis]
MASQQQNGPSPISYDHMNACDMALQVNSAETREINHQASTINLTFYNGSRRPTELPPRDDLHEPTVFSGDGLPTPPESPSHAPNHYAPAESDRLAEPSGQVGPEVLSSGTGLQDTKSGRSQKAAAICIGVVTLGLIIGLTLGLALGLHPPSSSSSKQMASTGSSSLTSTLISTPLASSTSSSNTSNTIHSTEDAPQSSDPTSPSTNSASTTPASPSISAASAASTSCTSNCPNPTTSSSVLSTTSTLEPTVTPALSTTTSRRASTSRVSCTVDGNCPYGMDCDYTVSTCFTCVYATYAMSCSGDEYNGCCDPWLCINNICTTTV